MSDETNKKSALAEMVQALKEPGATNAEVILPAAKEVVLPAAKQIGKGLEDLFFIAFSPFSNKRAEIEAKQRLLLNDVNDRVSQIPPEKLMEPSLATTGRAIDEAKFSVEDENIRTMFAKLIATSVNSDYKDAALPAFVEVLKQLSPFDAKNLNELCVIDNQGLGYNRVVGVIRHLTDIKKGTGKNLVENFIPFKHIDIENYSYYEASVDNLLRLGIIQIKYKKTYNNKKYHVALSKHQLYKGFQNIINNNGKKGHKVVLQNAIWDFTNFGRFFIKCCIEEAQ